MIWEFTRLINTLIESIPVLSVLPYEIIVRTGQYFPLDDEQETQELIELCLSYGIPAISLMIKDDETGKLFFPSSLPYTQTYQNYPASYLSDFINYAHQYRVP